MSSSVISATKPFLRWAGSKRKLIPRLRLYWNEGYGRYVEPFAGSSCLFFALEPQAALLADKNKELIETYEIVRERPEALHRSVSAFPRNASTYYRERDRDASGLCKFDRAVRFVYLNRNCFNGIYRTNKAGRFNVPFARSKAGAFLTVSELIRCATLLERAELRHCDFGTTLRCTRSGDFVYLDPPFAVSTRRVFREYGANSFKDDDLARLARHLKNLNERDISFVVSYADSPEARLLAKPWRHKRAPVRRQIAGFTGDRRMAYELMITNIKMKRDSNDK